MSKPSKPSPTGGVALDYWTQGQNPYGIGIGGVQGWFGHRLDTWTASLEDLAHADDLGEGAADVLGGLAGEALDLDLDRERIVDRLGEHARRHEAALGEQLERAQQHGRLDVGFETVSDGGGVALKRQDGRRHGRIPRLLDEQQQAGLQRKP